MPGRSDREQRSLDSGGGRLGPRSAFLAGCGIALILAALTLTALVIVNPFLVDSLALALGAFVLAPFAVGGVLGLLVAALASRRGGRSARRHRISVRCATVLAVTGLVLAFVTCLGGRAVGIRTHRGPTEPRLKLLLIGIDGATWGIIEPMIARGELPNIARVVDEGSAGTLWSINPMYSPRLFTTIATGRTADEHGVQGPSDTTSDAVLVRRVWDILWQQRGWDYGLLEWYVTSPPVASEDGFVIPGPPAVTTNSGAASSSLVVGW